MPLPTNIVWRDRTAYVRIEVPADVQEAFGRKLVRESLKTSNERDAIRLGLARLAALAEEWEDIRKRRAITPEDHHRIASTFYLDKLEADRKRRANYATALEIEAAAEAMGDTSGITEATRLNDDQLDYLAAVLRPDHDATFRADLLAALRSGLRKGSTYVITEAVREIETRADAVIRSDKLLIVKGSAEYRDLCQTLQRSWLQALEREVERDSGRWDGVPKDDIVIPPKASAVVTAEPGETIMEQFDTYARANPNNIKADTLDYSRKCVAIFAESLPKGFPASRIDKKAVRDWHDLLREFPVKAAEIKEFRGLPIRKVVEKNRTLGKPTLTKQTMNKYLSALGSFCNWLVKRGVIEANPTLGMHDKLDKEGNSPNPYTTEQLTRIFSSPIYTGFLSDEKDFFPGNQQADDWRRWLPLLALFTGARLGELAQLLTSDVREMHGRMVIFVTKHGDAGKSLKNKHSQRVIPIHDELVKLGFLAFHARAVENKQARLFPEIEPDARGQISGKPSGWYRRYVQRIGVKEDRSVNFHSFRHGLTDACRRAGYLNSGFGFLLGQADQGAATTRGYGAIPEGTLQMRIEIIDAVSFPGLDLSHLYPAKT